MKLKLIAVAIGLSVAVCAARASEIDFSGVVTSAVGSGIFSPPPISVGDTFSGSVIFESSNTVLEEGVNFPESGLFMGGGRGLGLLIPISNGYSFEATIPGCPGFGIDCGFAFEFHDTVNSFSAGASGLDPLQDFQEYEGVISRFSVSIPEDGGTILFLAMSLIPLIAARIKRLA
jgi:hypothetical protein